MAGLETSGKRKRCLDGLDMPAQLETLLNHYEVVDLIACTLVKCKLALSHDALTRQVATHTSDAVDSDRVIRQAWAVAPHVLALEQRPVLAERRDAASDSDASSEQYRLHVLFPTIAGVKLTHTQTRVGQLRRALLEFAAEAAARADGSADRLGPSAAGLAAAFDAAGLAPPPARARRPPCPLRPRRRPRPIR